MKFVIEVDEFWLEEEELETKLKEYITNSVIVQINKSIESRVETQIKMEVKLQVEQNLYRQINEKIKEVLSTNTVTDQYDKNKKILLADYISKEISDRASYNSSIQSTIENMAKKIGADLKQRYDISFAAHIVKNMNQNGLLKDEMIAKLLETGKS